MVRKRKSKSDPPPAPIPTPSQEPPAAKPPDDDFSKYLAEHPEGFYLTSIPELKEAGLEYDGILSEPKNLQHDLHLIEMGKAVGRSRRKERRSSPITIRRNVEICDRRKQNKSKWTLGRLAKEYGVKRQTIVSILNDEEKWRRLATSL